MQFEIGVLIGRFQPFHEGHAGLLRAALTNARSVVVVLGSAKAPRSVRNPFRTDERVQMIEANFPPEHTSRIRIVEVRDRFDDDRAWADDVRAKVSDEIGTQASVNVSAKTGDAAKPKLAIFGFEHDTEDYQAWFPDWTFVADSSHSSLSAAKIREDFLRDPMSAKRAEGLSATTKTWLMEFAKSNAHRTLADEQKAIDEYKAAWSSSPFPPVFVTTDAVVTKARHVLLIKRKKSPGRELWALPGGFLDPNEVLLEGALRELDEETKIALPRADIKAALKGVKTFDHPLRSARGRTITHAHHFELPGEGLAKVLGSDDAAEARWVPLAELDAMEGELFEDHFHILRSFLRRY